jgi:DNA-binding transcriptional regulator GbsR (MarR family)
MKRWLFVLILISPIAFAAPQAEEDDEEDCEVLIEQNNKLAAENQHLRKELNSAKKLIEEMKGQLDKVLKLQNQVLDSLEKRQLQK